MKKFTFLVAALCATMMASAAVTFTGNAIGAAGTEGSGGLVEKTIDGVTLSIDKGYVKIDPKNDVNWIRAYSGATMTISATSNISKIVITTTDPESSTKDKFSAAAFSASSYSVSSDKTVGTWTGSATSVTFSASAQVRMISVEVTLGEGGEGEGGEEGGDAIVIEGLAYADAYWDTDYQYWEFDLYKDYDSESKILTYPEVYFSVTGGTETTIADDDIMFDPENDDVALYVKAAGDTIFFVDGTVSIVAKGEGVYAFDCTFEDKDGQAYTFKTEVGVYASAVTWDEATGDWVYEDVVLTDEASTAIRTVEIDNTVYARDGRIYAEEGARIYSLTGLDVTRMNGNLEGIYIVKNGNKVAKVAVAK